MSARTFGRMLAGDLRHGLRAVALRFALVAVVALAVGFAAYGSVLVNSPELAGALNAGDCVFAAFAGMERFLPEERRPFEFPIAWLALFLAAAYVTFDYPTRDLAGMGARIVAVTGGRWSWWLAKCAWVAVCVVAVCAIALGACALVTVVAGGDWSLEPHPDIARYAGVNGVGTLSVEGNILGFVLVMPLVLCALLMTQLLVSLLAGPIVGLGLTAAVLLFSAFYVNPCAPGNYLMAARQNIALTGGVDPAMGAVLACAVLAACIVAGGIVFRRRDIVHRKDDLS